MNNVHPDDSVYSYNIKTKHIELAKVSKIFVRETHNFVKLQFEGDSLLALNGSKVCINSVSKFKTDTATLVYNFKPDSTYRYFVGGAAVLVHNAEYGFLSSDRLAKIFGISEKEFHRSLKDIIKKDFVSELKRYGIKNPDIGINGSGNIMFRNPSTKKILFESNVPYTIYVK